MSLTTYTYINPDDFTSGPGYQGLYVNISQLINEIDRSGDITSTTLNRIDTKTNQVHIIFNNELLSSEQTALTTIVNNHVPLQSREVRIISSDTIDSSVSGGDLKIAPKNAANLYIGASDTSVNFYGQIDSAFAIQNLLFNGNTITTTNTNGDVEISAQGTGKVITTREVEIGNLALNGSTFSTIGGNADLVLSPNGTGKTVSLKEIDVENLGLIGNTIKSLDTDGNINLTPNGAGKTVSAKEVNVGNIAFNGNTISILNSNGNLNLNPNGTGKVVVNTNEMDVGNIALNGNVISSINTNGDITLTPNGTGKVIVSSNLDVEGVTTSIDSINVNIADAYLYSNKGYVTNAPKTTGWVCNANPTTTSTTSTTGGFANSSSVNVTSTNGFQSGDIIQISSSSNLNNEGIFQISTLGSGVINIDNSGEDFVQTEFTTDTSDTSAVITKTNVAVIRAADGAGNTPLGQFEIGYGAQSPVTFSELLTPSTLTIPSSDKGDLLIGNSSGTFDRQSIGTLNQILTVSSDNELLWQSNLNANNISANSVTSTNNYISNIVSSDISTETLSVNSTSNVTQMNASDITTNDFTSTGQFTADVYPTIIKSSDKGDLIIGNASSSFDVLQKGSVDQILTMSSDSNLVWKFGINTTTIDSNSLDSSNVYFNVLSGSDSTMNTLTVDGTSNMTTINSSDITTNTLTVDGTSNMTTINSSDITTNNFISTGQFSADVFSTSLKSSDQGDLLVGDASSSFSLIQKGSVNQILTSSSDSLLWLSDLNLNSITSTNINFQSITGSDSTTNTLTVSGTSNMTTINSSDITTNNFTSTGQFSADVFSTSLKSSDQGDLLVGDASSSFSLVPIGNVDQVLTTSSDNNLIWKSSTTQINVNSQFTLGTFYKTVPNILNGENDLALGINRIVTEAENIWVRESSDSVRFTLEYSYTGSPPIEIARMNGDEDGIIGGDVVGSNGELVYLIRSGSTWTVDDTFLGGGDIGDLAFSKNGNHLITMGRSGNTASTTIANYYDYQTFGQWIERFDWGFNNLFSSDLDIGGNTGTVVIDDNGNRAFLGSSKEQAGQPGLLYVFLRDGTDWTEEKRFSPSSDVSSFCRNVISNGDASELLIFSHSSDPTDALILDKWTRSGTTWSFKWSNNFTSMVYPIADTVSITDDWKRILVTNSDLNGGYLQQIEGSDGYEYYRYSIEDQNAAGRISRDGKFMFDDTHLKVSSLNPTEGTTNLKSQGFSTGDIVVDQFGNLKTVF